MLYFYMDQRFGGIDLYSVSSENLHKEYDMAERKLVIRDLHHPELRMLELVPQVRDDPDQPLDKR